MALRRPTPGLPMATNGSTFLMTPGMRSWPGRRRTGRPCRRGRGFATYAAIRQLGRLGIAGMIDRCCEHARTLVEGIWRLDGSEVLWQPRINQGLVRFLDPRPGAHEEDHDRFTDIVIQRVLDSGEAFFMGTSWLGRRAMRVSVLNWQTSEADVDRAIAAIQRCLTSARSAPATQAESSQGDGTL